MSVSLQTTIEDKVKGTLLGLIAGDRNGGPSAMALELAKSLLRQKKFDLEDIGNSYLNWWRTDGVDSGEVAQETLNLVLNGLTFKEASYRVDQELGGKTGGCNPAHRIAPLAMTAFVSQKDLAYFAVQEAKLTHWHRVAGEIAGAVAKLSRLLILGIDWNEALQQIRNESNWIIKSALAPTAQLVLRDGGYAPDVIQAALYFIEDSDSFAEALSRGLKFAGADNYCPVLIGAIGGAYWGRQAISDDLLKHSKVRLEAEQVAQALADTWNSGA